MKARPKTADGFVGGRLEVIRNAGLLTDEKRIRGEYAMGGLDSRIEGNDVVRVAVVALEGIRHGGEVTTAESVGVDAVGSHYANDSG